MNAITIRQFGNSKLMRETFAVLGAFFFLTLVPYKNEVWQMKTIHQSSGNQYDWWTQVGIDHGYTFSLLIPATAFAMEVFMLELLFLSGLYIYSKRFSILEKSNMIWKEVLIITSTLVLASIALPTWQFSPLSNGMQFTGYDFLWNVHVHHLHFYIFYAQLIVGLSVLYFVRKRYSEQIQTLFLK